MQGEVFYSKGTPHCNLCYIYCSEILAFESISIFSVIHMQSRIHARKVDNDFS